jgi:hypothetical protein
MNGNPRQVSLWDAEEAEPVTVRAMTVGAVSSLEVDEFCRRYHYTATGGSMLWRYGLWHGPTLWGIVSYNLPNRNVCECVFGPNHWNNVWHMGRLVLPDHAPHNSESRLIGGSLRLIQQQRPDVWAVITYAASDVGHIGYVYQATNAIYTGTSAVEPVLTDAFGRRRARRTAYTKHHPTTKDTERLGWVKTKGDVKHRYVYLLGNKQQRRQRRAMLRLPELPYPKQTSNNQQPETLPTKTGPVPSAS